MTSKWAFQRHAQSVTGRFRSLLIVVFTAGAMVALVAAWLFAGAAADEAYDRLLVSAAVQIADSVELRQGAIDVYPPDSAFETLALAGNDRVFYSVHGPAGHLLTGYPRLPVATRSREPGLRLGDAIFAGASIRLVTLDRYVQSAERSGRVQVTVAETRLARGTMQWELFSKFAAVTIGLTSLGLLAALRAARLATRPLLQLELALAAREPQDLTPLTIDGPRETQALIDEINRLMSRLGLRLETLRQFSAVAAHQLRTPLAALSSQLELLAHEESRTAQRERVERLRVRLRELNRLVHQLLGHAMIAYRGEAHHRERVDLVALARSVLMHDVPQSLERDIRLGLDCAEDSIHVVGDDVMLREAIANLVNNAISYGAPSLLEIRIRSDGEFALITVIDDGPGIAEHAREAAMHPFSSSRSDGKGAGLGLSIVKETVTAHQGSLCFDWTEEHHFGVSLRLPLGDAQ